MSSYLSANDGSKKIENNGEVMNKSQIQKLLGVHIDYELKFDAHIEALCEKVGKNLLALSRVVKFMSTSEAQLLMRSTCLNSATVDSSGCVIVEILIVK